MMLNNYEKSECRLISSTFSLGEKSSGRLLTNLSLGSSPVLLAI